MGDTCFQHCKFSADGKAIDGPWYMQEPLYLRWKQWDCQSDCQYECMMTREEERRRNGERPTKYFGKWPLNHVYGIQVIFFLQFCISLEASVSRNIVPDIYVYIYRNLSLLLSLLSTLRCNSKDGSLISSSFTINCLFSKIEKLTTSTTDYCISMPSS